MGRQRSIHPSGRNVTQGTDHYELTEPLADYKVVFAPENVFLGIEKASFLG